MSADLPTRDDYEGSASHQYNYPPREQRKPRPSHYSNHYDDYRQPPQNPASSYRRDHSDFPQRRRYDREDSQTNNGNGYYSQRNRSASPQRRSRSREVEPYQPAARRPQQHHHIRDDRPYAAPAGPIDKCTPEESTTIWLGNLPYDFVEQDIWEMFGSFGKVEKVTVPMDRRTGKNKGFAFIQFNEKREAQVAYEHFKGTTVEGRPVKIDWDLKVTTPVPVPPPVAVPQRNVGYHERERPTAYDYD